MAERGKENFRTDRQNIAGKMISVLIPVYNENCVQLVSELHAQAEELGFDFEILVVDDHSPHPDKANRVIRQWSGVYYEELPQNYGRAKIRNYMAEKAKGDYLVFLDGDSGINNRCFLKNYCCFMGKYDVVCGGTEYCQKEFVDRKCILHWKNGSIRESNAKKGNTACFTSNNFMIRKQVFSDTGFDVELKTYGHEDTLFDIMLKEHNVKIKHIDNPVVHLGLKPFDKFISDIESATRNLKTIYDKYGHKIDLNRIRLVKAASYLKRLHLCGLYRVVFRIFKPFMLYCLKSKNPNLYILDLYKLGIYVESC